MVLPTVNEEEAKQTYGDKLKTVLVPSGKNYIRIVPQPKCA